MQKQQKPTSSRPGEKVGLQYLTPSSPPSAIGNDGGALVNDYNIIIPHNESNVNAVKQTISQLVGI
jgi:hypothetical protein